MVRKIHPSRYLRHDWESSLPRILLVEDFLAESGLMQVGLKKIKHVLELYDYIRKGEHEYAFEWERNRGFEDSLRDLLDKWLGEARKEPPGWKTRKSGSSTIEFWTVLNSDRRKIT